MLLRFSVLVLAVFGPCQGKAQTEAQQSAVTDDGTIYLPRGSVPYSDLASDESKQAFLRYVREGEELRRVYEDLKASLGRTPSIDEVRDLRNSELMIPRLDRLRKIFAVDIVPEDIGGVQTDVVLPAEGVPSDNENKVLINLHGGGFGYNARYGGQVESVPVASLGAIKVVTIDYRMWPEHGFPAASQDVAKVYRVLLETYPAENIGMYGCSAGGILAAQAVAWFQVHDLPRPGATGMFSGAAVVGRWGDSIYVSSAILTGTMPAMEPDTLEYFNEVNHADPLVSPAHHPRVLRQFPPSLLLSGTRDPLLSSVIYTHAQLTKAGVEADLHVWEGAPHCSYAGHADPNVPETREAWNVIVQFFTKHLGRKGSR